MLVSFLSSFILAGPALADPAHLQRVQACLLDRGCDRLIVAAHRQGYAGTFENSLWAVKQNIGKDTDVLEVDVRETRDGQLVLMHDLTVNRTTNGSGEVGRLTLDQIERLRIKGLDEPPPTFEQVAQAAEGNAFLLVDIKSAPVRKVWAIVKKYGLEKQAILFVDNAWEYFQLNALLISREDVLFVPRLHAKDDVGALMDGFYRMPRFVHIDEKTLSPEVLRAIQSRGARAYMHYPAVSDEKLREAGLERRRQGVHFFDHDDPRRVYDALADYR